jgi:D-methionine transport system ATP-binding protein
VVPQVEIFVLCNLLQRTFFIIQGDGFMIKIKNITKKYANQNDEIALNDVTTKFEQGFIHGIIGMSGAGKSSLIRLLNKLENYDSGYINVFDYGDLKKLNKEKTRMLRKDIGMIFQSDHLLSRKTVLENVLLPITFHHEITDDDRDYAHKLLEEVGLKDYISRYPSQLSGGQKQRVGIARALINRPKLLICDEPTSALDVITTHHILRLIKNMSEKHQVNVILVTHDMSVIKEICDTVTIMDKGKIIEQGFLDDILYKAKQHQTKMFIKDVGLNIPDYINKNELLFLKFSEKIVSKNIIANMIKDLNINISIIYANITPNQKGVMLIQANEKKELIYQYLSQQKVVVEYVV